MEGKFTKPRPSPSGRSVFDIRSSTGNAMVTTALVRAANHSRAVQQLGAGQGAEKTRFIVVCPLGHMQDVDWYGIVSSMGGSCAGSCRPEIPLGGWRRCPPLCERSVSELRWCCQPRGGLFPRVALLRGVSRGEERKFGTVPGYELGTDYSAWRIQRLHPRDRDCADDSSCGPGIAPPPWSACSPDPVFRPPAREFCRFGGNPSSFASAKCH